MSVWFEPLKPSQFSKHQVSLKMKTIELKILKISGHFENQVENQLETLSTDLWYPPNTDFYHSTSVGGWLTQGPIKKH